MKEARPKKYILHDSIYIKYSKKCKLIYSDKSLRMSVKERETLRDNIHINFHDYVKIFNGSIHVKIQIVHFKYVHCIIPQLKTHVNISRTLRT